MAFSFSLISLLPEAFLTDQEKIKRATGLNDGSGPANHALNKLPFGFRNSLKKLEIEQFWKRDLAEQKEFEENRTDKIKNYLLKMVGACALEPQVTHLLIRSGHFDAIVFDALAHSLETIEQIHQEKSDKSSWWCNSLKIQIALIDTYTNEDFTENKEAISTSQLKDLIFAPNDKGLTDNQKKNLYKKNHTSWRFIEFLRKHQFQIDFLCVRDHRGFVSNEEIQEKVRFIGFFDDLNKVRMTRTWRGYDKNQEDNDDELYQADVYFKSVLFDKELCQKLILNDKDNRPEVIVHKKQDISVSNNSPTEKSAPSFAEVH